jgi:hypothetical protein
VKRSPGAITGSMAILCLGASSLLAQSYYYTDTLTTINTTNWTENGTLTAGPGGLSSSTQSYGGSLISKIAVPDGTSDYEEKITLNLPGTPTNEGQEYYMYLHGSSNILAPDSSGVQTGYLFEIIYPWACPTGECVGTLMFWRATADPPF